MRKSTKSSLKNKLDKEISRIVRARGICAFCGNQDYSKLQTAHIISRSHLGLRWRLDNVLCLCAACHFLGHKNPLLFAEKVKEYLGELKYTEIYLASRSLAKWTIPELHNLLETLRKIE